MLVELGHESSVVGITRMYRDLAATLVVDQADAESASAVEDEGMACLVTNTIMSDPQRSAALATETLEAVTR